MDKAGRRSEIPHGRHVDERVATKSSMQNAVGSMNTSLETPPHENRRFSVETHSKDLVDCLANSVMIENVERITIFRVGLHAGPLAMHDFLYPRFAVQVDMRGVKIASRG